MAIIEQILDIVRPKGKRGVAGIWHDEHGLVEAARKVREMGIKNFEAITPFPVHGLDDAMGIPLSFIPWVTFICGLCGCAFGLWFTWWTFCRDWPLNIGGKPFFSLPAYIPIMFELTILFGALCSVGTLFVVCGLPAVEPPIIDPDLTSHKFGLFIATGESGHDSAKLEKLLTDLGANEIKHTEF
jgi:Protein of unknown function (DUF3341)